MVSRFVRSRAKRRRNRSPLGAAEVSQFALVTYILFLVLLIPLLDLSFLLLAAATQYLATNDAVSKAAMQANLSAALNNMGVEALHFQSLGLARFISLTPQGGYVGCGDDLYVVSTDIGSGAVSKSAANTALTKPIDLKQNIYEMSVQSTYSVAPCIRLSGLPILKDVPGLGQPVVLTFVASRPVEHPAGLNQSGNGATSSGRVADFNRRAENEPINPVANGTWNNPNIFTQIKNAGQTVVSVNVFIVHANNPLWTASGVTIAPGQKLWIDTQAVGIWSPSAASPTYNGNGSGNLGPNQIAPALSDCGLIAEVGANGQYFLVGTGQLNYSPLGNGAITMIFNDEPGHFADNTGAQEVRIIVTR